MKQYKNDFLPLGWSAGYCSLTVMIGILNYFFDTNLAAKDNFDIFGLVKWGRRNQGELLNLDEIALFLDRLYLHVTHFSGVSKDDAKLYYQGNKIEKIKIIKKYTKPEFHHCIQGEKRVFENGTSIDMIDALLEKRIGKSSITYKNGFSDKEIINVIKKNQKIDQGGVMFVLGLSYNILYETKKISNDGEGHVVISTGITKNNQFIIYEAIRPRPNPHLIPVERVLKSMHDTGAYSFLMIKDNSEHFL